MEVLGDFRGKCTAVATFEKSKHVEFAEKYAMTFQNAATRVMVDPCFGTDFFDRRLAPFAVMNEPPEGVYANCEVVSKFAADESATEPWLRSVLRVYANLPILPRDELFIHYGADFDRDYAVGFPSPLFFHDLRWADGVSDLTKQALLCPKPYSVVEWKRKTGLAVRRDRLPPQLPRVTEIRLSRPFRERFGRKQIRRWVAQPRFFKKRKNSLLFSCTSRSRHPVETLSSVVGAGRTGTTGVRDNERGPGKPPLSEAVASSRLPRSYVSEPKFETNVLQAEGPQEEVCSRCKRNSEQAVGEQMSRAQPHQAAREEQPPVVGCCS
eukprot:g13775.t1